MKKFFAILMALALMLGLCACGNKKSELEIAREVYEANQKALEEAEKNLEQSKQQLEWTKDLFD